MPVAARAPRLGRRLRIPHLGVVGHFRRHRFGGLGRGVGHLLARDLGLLDLGLGVLRFGPLPVLAGELLLAFLVALIGLILVALGAPVLAHVEGIEQIVHHIAEARLIFDQPLQPVEIAPGPVLDQRAPQIDQSRGRRRRAHPGQPFAHDQGQRLLDRGVGAIGDLVELAAMKTIVQHSGQVVGDPGHAPGADRFDPRLLHRVEHRARLLAAGHQLAMHPGIVTGELEGDRVGVAAHDGGVGGRELARRLGQARLAADHAGPLGRKADLEVGLARDRPQAAGNRPLERINRALLGGRLGLVAGGHWVRRSWVRRSWGR